MIRLAFYKPSLVNSISKDATGILFISLTIGSLFKLETRDNDLSPPNLSLSLALFFFFSSNY